MLAIRLDKELERELDLLAKTRGSNRSAVVREAIIQLRRLGRVPAISSRRLSHPV